MIKALLAGERVSHEVTDIQGKKQWWYIMGAWAFASPKEIIRPKVLHPYAGNPPSVVISHLLRQYLEQDQEMLTPTGSTCKRGKLTLCELATEQGDPVWVMNSILQLFPSSKYLFSQLKGARFSMIVCVRKGGDFVAEGMMGPYNIHRAE